MSLYVYAQSKCVSEPARSKSAALSIEKAVEIKPLEVV